VKTSESVSYAVVEAIAEREGVRPAELSYPLFEAINPEALDTLFRDTLGHLSFEFHGYVVTVDQDGAVELSRVGEE
jgi:hypothetical protein